MPPADPWVDAQTLLAAALVAAALLLALSPLPARPWLSLTLLALVALPPWIDVAHALPHTSARRASRALATRASILALAGTLLLLLHAAH